MNEQPKPEGLNHREGYCLMPYICEKCKTGEWVWNSRDGVTPFLIGCPHPECDGVMAHVMAGLDIRARIGHRLPDLSHLRRRSEVWHRFLVASLEPGVRDGGPFRPSRGMRVFVDLTLEKAAANAEARAWNPDWFDYLPDGVQAYVRDTPPGEHRPDHPRYGDFVEFRNRVAADDCRLEQGGGQPTLETWPIIDLERARTER